jgi:adenylate kinase family enzyme
VLVVGPGGAGKTTFSLRLGELLGLPVMHLDSFYWRPGWEAPSDGEWEATVRRLTAGRAWVMDGNYGGTLDLRLRAADTVVFLDPPRLLCLWRLARRRLRYRGRSRPDMAPGCSERLTPEFLRYVWTYPTRRRPGVMRKLERLRHSKSVFVLRSPAETRRFLADLPVVARKGAA